MELRRVKGLVLAAAVVLSGCSSSGPGPLVATIQSGLAQGDAGAAGANPAKTITRAQIEAMGVALLRVEETLLPASNLLVAFRQSGPQVTYVLRSERRLVLHGGLVQSTYGFGRNLPPVGVSGEDPVAFPRPLADWPQRVARDYVLSDRGPGQATRVTCRFRFGKVGVVRIVERPQRVQEVVETCKGDGVRFENRHHVDPATGFVWASRQWTGPQQGMLRYEVLEPLD